MCRTVEALAATALRIPTNAIVCGKKCDVAAYVSARHDAFGHGQVRVRIVG